MKKPNQPTNQPPSNQPNTHTLKDREEPGDLTNYEWILLVHLNFYLYSCHSLWFYLYFSQIRFSCPLFFNDKLEFILDHIFSCTHFSRVTLFALLVNSSLTKLSLRAILKQLLLLQPASLSGKSLRALSCSPF